jgi:CubicO group peptidase (beta-lactamase class C family)
MLVAAAGCTSPAPETDPDDAESVLLEHAADADSRCILVMRDGEIVTSTPDVTEPQRAWSITKSVASLLVGIAVDDGALALEDRASDYIPQWRGTESESVTVRDLLAMVSGREWTRQLDYRDMALRAKDKTAFALDLGQDSAPGTVWVYNNSAVQTLDAVLEAATGVAVEEFAAARLFDPLGMTSSSIDTDKAGNANLFAGMLTTCTDLAVLGQAVLRGGASADGAQVIPPGYLSLALEPSTDLNAAYGLLWWLNQPGKAVAADVATGGEPTPIVGPLVPEAAANTVWAVGFQQQILAVIPSMNAVAVRLGGKPPEGSSFDVRSFTSDVLDVLGEQGS